MSTPFDEEAQPLLRPRRGRENSVASFFARGRSNTINSLKSGYQTVKKHKDEFIYLFIGSLLLYLGFTLAFLPRTSLGRDLRRLHFSRLTRAETFRIYVESLLTENKCEEHLKKYTSRSHLAGDSGSLDYTVEQFSSLGFSPSLTKYYTWLNEPLFTEVSLWQNDVLAFNASMIEDALDDDPTSGNTDSIMGFHGYSANGTVQASYVYCNYGTIDDYEQLKQNKIGLEGKIHIIRYSAIFRGLKVKNAEEHGAVGVILYTDSFDDGLFTEANGYKAYPEGPARHESSIQRGSVVYFTDFPGDPTTPGYASKSKYTTRLSPEGKLPSIPSVPLSEREVAPLLQKLNGKGFRWANEGNVKGFDYSSGPSDDGIECKIVNEQKYLIKEIVNVVVEIQGILKNQDIIVGNHRDSWVVGGAGDPNGGSAALLEVARGLSELRSHGWKPLRTIKLISWDGEEPGMLGSTEYGEDYKSKLNENTIAYFNLDTAVTGSKLNLEANPLLNKLLRRTSKNTIFKGDPSVTLHDYWKETGNLDIERLGGGTDFVVFQHNIGIPSVDFKFARDPSKDPVYQYHSNYDSFTWMKKFGDPDFSLHNTMAMFLGLSVLSLSENELLLFNTNAYMSEISKYYTSLHESIGEVFPKDEEISMLGQNLVDLLELLTSHTSISFDEMVEYLAEQTEQDYPWWKWNKKLVILTKLTATNAKLRKLDRYFVTERGLKDRPFMKHSIFGPDKFEGYSGSVIPGLKEALYYRDRKECVFWLETLLSQLDKVVSLLTV